MITDQFGNPIPDSLTIGASQASSQFWIDTLTPAQLATHGYRLRVEEAGDAPLGYLPAVAQDQGGVPVWYFALRGTEQEQAAALAEQAIAEVRPKWAATNRAKKARDAHDIAKDGSATTDARINALYQLITERE
jgi:hypothetical protein